MTMTATVAAQRMPSTNGEPTLASRVDTGSLGSAASNGSPSAHTNNSSSVRPASAGRTRGLRRRFTTPPEASAQSGSASSLHQYYAPFPDRETSDSSEVFVYTNDSIEDIQSRIISQSDHLRSLRLRACSKLTSANLHDIIRCVTPKLLSFEIREAEDSNHFDLDHLQHLVSKCKHLRALHFEDCFLIDHRCLEHIGHHLLELQNIAFVHTKRKQWPDNPIHELVLHVPLELHSLKFVGFDEIADYHVNYAVDCYFGSLNAISLGDCSGISDRSVDYIATNCKLLRHIELFKCPGISDSTLWILAKHCSNLHYIDLSSCNKITDYGVKELVTHAAHLRYINLSCNSKIRNLAFISIIRHCTNIARIRLDNTGVTAIPASILKRKQTLREVSLKDCKDMPESIVNTMQGPNGLNDYMDQIDDRHLNYRLKVFAVGASGTGKTALIRCLTGKTDAKGPEVEGVNVQSWRPFKEGSWENVVGRELVEEERLLCLDYWDCQGREVLRGVHPVYFTDVCIYYVVCSLEDSLSVEKVPTLVHTIYEKALRPQIYIIATRSDKFSDDDCQTKLDLIKRSIDSADLVRRNSCKVELTLMQDIPDKDAFLERKKIELQRRLEEKYSIRKYSAVSTATGKGVDVVRKHLLSLCLDNNTFPHLKRAIPPGWIEFHDEIIRKREQNIACMVWHDFEQLALKDEKVSKPRLDECIAFLHQVGVVIDLRTRSTVFPTDLICINPPVFAACACALHIDDQKKSFRFEAKRFWPKERAANPPNPAILAGALEDIPNRGLLKESLLPLLWQDLLSDEDQVTKMRTAILDACLLAVNKSSKSASNTLTLPGFPQLLPQNQFVVPLLNLLADAKPQLNWTSRPFRGDLQLTLCMYFLPVMPPGLTHRLVALVNNALVDKSAYHYYWKFGTLTRIQDILLFISCEQDAFLEISARTTPEEEHDTAGVLSLWLEVVFVMNMVTEFINTCWTGMRTTVSLICYGDAFYMEEKIESEPEITLPKVFQCAKAKEDIEFQDAGEQKFLEVTKLLPVEIAPNSDQDYVAWLQSVLDYRERFPHSQNNQPSEASTRSSESSPSASQQKKKKISINWLVPGSEIADSPNGTQKSLLNGHLEATPSPPPSRETQAVEYTLIKPETPIATVSSPEVPSEPPVNPDDSAIRVTTSEESIPRPRTNTLQTTKSTKSAENPIAEPSRPQASSSSPTPATHPDAPPPSSTHTASIEVPVGPSKSNSAGSGRKTRSKTCTIL